MQRDNEIDPSVAEAALMAIARLVDSMWNEPNECADKFSEREAMQARPGQLGGARLSPKD